jgi:hypothetical protein
MQDLNSANITMEAMDCEINTVSSSFKNKEKVFDEKNYLNIRLSDNQTTKELKFRLLPIDGESNTPFKKIHVHTVKVPKEVSPSGWKSYICIEKTDGIDRNIYGSKCPFCEMNREAYKKFTEATEPTIKERWKKISLDNIPKEACIVRGIERGAEEDGPKFWKFNIRKDKTDPKGQIMELYKTRLEESREEGLEDENILDINTGKDLKITISLASDNNQGENRTSVKIVDYGKNKPLSTDVNQMLEWVNDSKKWSDVFTIKPYDYLSVILEGEIPFYDKTLNKWVKKMDKLKEQENQVNDINQKIADAEAMVIINNNVDVTMSAPVTDATSDELPF